jgi:ribonuclease HI
MSDPIVIFIDGGCRGNGGSSPKAYGSMAVFHKGEQKRLERWEFNDATTNNQSEYGALLAAFEYLKCLIFKMDGKPLPPVVIKTDSQLVFEQLSGNFKVKKTALKPLHEAARTWLADHPTVSLEKVGRDEIEAVLGH